MWIRRVFLVILPIFTVFLQVSLVHWISPFGIGPYLPLILVIYFSFREGPLEVTLASAWTGLLLDAFTPETFGLQSFLLSTMGYWGRYVYRHVHITHLGFLFAFTGGFALIYALAMLVAGILMSQPAAGYLLIRYALPSAIYTALLGGAILLLVVRMMKDA